MPGVGHGPCWRPRSTGFPGGGIALALAPVPAAWQIGFVIWEWLKTMGNALWPGTHVLLEIAILSVLIYYAILFFRGTRGSQVLFGFVIALVALLFLTRNFHLDTLNWLLQQVSVYFVIAFVIIFQPEIRRALAELGKQHVFSVKRERSVLEEIVKAVTQLAGGKIGALMAIEREINTLAVQETGVRLDALVSADLLTTIFYPRTTLHDGGVIIEGNRIRAAGCVFPLSARDIGKTGTRHRAAVGLAEDTDAVVIAISEETGAISLAFRGRLIRGLDEERLRRILTTILARAPRIRNRWQRLRSTLDLSTEGLAHTEEMMEREVEDSP